MLLAAVLLFSGCSTYSSKFADLRPQLVQQDYEAALATIEKQSGSKDQLLYYLERGLVLHFADRYQESNVEFATAERLADDLYTKSISEGVFSLVTNDNAISYRPRPFEMALVPYYKALNYIYLGQPDAAQVEARRASVHLAKYVDASLAGVRSEDGDLIRKVRNSAFLLYYSGMLYDSDGEINDAFTAYRNAANAYQINRTALNIEIPRTLSSDLQRLAGRLGFYAELDQLKKDCPDVFKEAELSEAKTKTREDYEEAVAHNGWQPGYGEVAFFLEAGFVAHKTQVRFDFPIFEGETYSDSNFWAWEIYAGLGNMQALVSGRKVEYWVSVAAPELQDPVGDIGGARITAGVSGGHSVTHQVSNLSRAARITFDSEKPTIFFKTIARGLTKYLASRQVGKKNELAGALANLFGSVTESADTRSWLTIPESIHLARMSLPAGIYDLKVEILDRGGRVIRSEMMPGVEVQPGEWTFVSRRVF
ncbi:MAG: hypothetical protein GY780_06935 [bacterium]|nr:hypothetical protein [bacterium]